MVSITDRLAPAVAPPDGVSREGQMNASMTRFDDRDLSVLDQLEKGQVVTPETVKRLYRRFTDVRQSRTLKRRVKDLTSQPEFENVGFRRWEYQGLE